MYYFNSRDEFYKKPFGAVKENQEITFTVWGDDNSLIPALSVMKDGGEEKLIPMNVIYIGGKRYYRACYTIECSGLYFYRFITGKDMYLFNGGKGESDEAETGEWYIQTVYAQDFRTPEFFKNGMVYQIFPDRFFEGKKKSKTLSFPDRIYREDKTGIPFFKWSPTEKHPINKDYFGGDFEGITEKMQYLYDLGVTCIYLNPIFESHSNHRYDTADYMKIDPELGTEEDFVRLCETAHGFGIRIILDGVFSHTGDDSIYFNKQKRYGEGGAFNDKNSPYREWFDFSENYKNGYRSWWDFPTMPETNENIPSYTEFICGENGVIKKWLRLGADGLRLDVADELPEEFIENIRKAVKSCGEDKLLIGEVWEDAITKFSMNMRRRYLLGRGLDSVMNYPFRTSVLKFIREGNGSRFCEEIYDIYEKYPKEAMDCAWNNLSTHDVPRAITYLASEIADGGDRDWQSVQKLSAQQFEKGKKMLLCAYALIFTLPGIPSVYYGDEIAMQGYRDPFNRGYFQWWNMQSDVLFGITKLATARKYHTQYSGGGLYFTHVSDDAVAFVRFDKNGEIMTGVNRGEETVSFDYKGRTYTIRPLGYFVTRI